MTASQSAAMAKATEALITQLTQGFFGVRLSLAGTKRKDRGNGVAQ
jgi:hypothetical protein